MDPLALSALVVAVVAIPVAVLATRQWGNRRAQIEFSSSSTPLLPDKVGRGLLAVTYRDIPVDDPHLVTVSVRNVGPRDISTAMFDSGQSISIRFDQTFYGLTVVSGGAHTLSPGVGASPEEATVLFEPGLLKRGDAWSFSAVLSGPVGVSIEAPLIDTDVREAVPDSDRPELTLRLSTLGLSAQLPIKLPKLPKVE
jgi:hypothetical protein